MYFHLGKPRRMKHNLKIFSTVVERRQELILYHIEFYRYQVTRHLILEDHSVLIRLILYRI
jgi:hypothetical protein